MKYFVLWSGGADSTYLILHLLNSGHSVTAGYVELLNNQVKTEMELAAIDKLVPCIKELHDGKFNFIGSVLSIDFKKYGDLIHLSQATTWIFSAIHTAPKDCKRIAVGYILNDYAISYLDDIKKVRNAHKGFSFESIPQLEFPLIKWNKHSIYSSLPRNILKHTVYCEAPKKDKNKRFRRCEKCNPCLKAKENNRSSYLVKKAVLKK